MMDSEGGAAVVFTGAELDLRILLFDTSVPLGCSSCVMSEIGRGAMLADKGAGGEVYNKVTITVVPIRK